jgi:hypothetical protein
VLIDPAENFSRDHLSCGVHHGNLADLLTFARLLEEMLFWIRSVGLELRGAAHARLPNIDGQPGIFGQAAGRYILSTG